MKLVTYITVHSIDETFKVVVDYEMNNGELDINSVKEVDGLNSFDADLFPDLYNECDEHYADMKAEKNIPLENTEL